MNLEFFNRIKYNLIKNFIKNSLKLFKIFKDEIFKCPSVYLNPHIFNIIDNDNFIEEYINNQINELYSQIDLLTNLINKIVNTLAWWIPTKKLRNNFRNKFKIAEQSRAEQSRAEQ